MLKDMSYYKYLEISIRPNERFYTVNPREIKLHSEEEFEEHLLKESHRFKTDEIRLTNMICDLKNEILGLSKDLSREVSNLEYKLAWKT